MPELAPRQKTRTAGGSVPTVEDDGAGGTFPERRLWIAVIVYSMTEYEEQLKHIKKLWDAERKALPRQLLNVLRVLRYELRHEWFGHVCDLAEIAQSHVLTRIKALDKQYGLAEIEFDETLTMPTRYQMRKARRDHA